jgi:hypothetical protein
MFLRRKSSSPSKLLTVPFSQGKNLKEEIQELKQEFDRRLRDFSDACDKNIDSIDEKGLLLKDLFREQHTCLGEEFNKIEADYKQALQNKEPLNKFVMVFRQHKKNVHELFTSQLLFFKRKPEIKTIFCDGLKQAYFFLSWLPEEEKTVVGYKSALHQLIIDGDTNRFQAYILTLEREIREKRFRIDLEQNISQARNLIEQIKKLGREPEDLIERLNRLEQSNQNGPELLSEVHNCISELGECFRESEEKYALDLKPRAEAVVKELFSSEEKPYLEKMRELEQHHQLSLRKHDFTQYTHFVCGLEKTLRASKIENYLIRVGKLEEEEKNILEKMEEYWTVKQQKNARKNFDEKMSYLTNRIKIIREDESSSIDELPALINALQQTLQEEKQCCVVALKNQIKGRKDNIQLLTRRPESELFAMLTHYLQADQPSANIFDLGLKLITEADAYIEQLQQGKQRAESEERKGVSHLPNLSFLAPPQTPRATTPEPSSISRRLSKQSGSLSRSKSFLRPGSNSPSPSPKTPRKFFLKQPDTPESQRDSDVGPKTPQPKQKTFSWKTSNLRAHSVEPKPRGRDKYKNFGR